MTNLIIAGVITTLIIGYRCVKRYHDRNCQDSYEQGVSDSMKIAKEESKISIKKAFRTGIEKCKQDLKIEDELYSKEIYNKIKGE